MRTINILSKPKNGKARIVHTMQIEDSFDAAVEAARVFALTLPKSSARIFWNWADSAWNRIR